MTQVKPPSAESSGVDLARLQRAIHLDVKRLSDGRFLVAGTERRVVDLAAAFPCECPDARIQGGPCKHELAVRLQVGDADVLAALRSIVPRDGRDARELAAAVR
jgi:hypothetical protein